MPESTLTLCLSRLQHFYHGQPYARVDLNLSQSRLQHIYQEQPRARVDYDTFTMGNPLPESTTKHLPWALGNPLPESTLTLCQSRIYPPSEGLWFWPQHSTCPFGMEESGERYTVVFAWIVTEQASERGGGCSCKVPKYTTKSFHLIGQIKDNTILHQFISRLPTIIRLQFNRHNTI
jgi:hypothetical protein